MTHSLGAVAMDKLFICTDIHHLKLQCPIHSSGCTKLLIPK